MMGRTTFVLLSIIVVFGSLLRCLYLSRLPAGFHGDEAAYGYNAYSIIKTGTDEYGARFPLVFKSFEDYKPALYGYIDIPFIMLLGLNEHATRLPSAIFGSITIILIYILTKRILKSDTRTALVAAFLFAISPWHIMFSRTTSEVIVSMFFLFAYFYSLYHIRDRFHVWWMIAGSVFGFLSLWAYTATRFSILILTGVVLLTTVRKTKSFFTISKPIVAMLAVIIILELIFNSLASNNRLSQVSIFHNPLTKLVLEEQIREDISVPVLLTRTVHNKITNYTRTIIANYSAYFSLDFLALEGGRPPRQRIPNAGLFYLWEMLFLVIGIYSVIRKRDPGGILLVILLPALLAPAVITFDDTPNVQRSIMILPVMIMLIAYGVTRSISFLAAHGKRILYPALIMLIGIAAYESLYFSHQYTVHAEYHQPWFRDYAMKPLVSALTTYGPRFEKIIITKNKTSYIHILFYTQFNPTEYKSSGSNMDKDYTGFGNYKFYPKECPLEIDEFGYSIEGKPRTLYVNTGTCPVPKDATAIETITWQDGNPAYTLVTLDDIR